MVLLFESLLGDVGTMLGSVKLYVGAGCRGEGSCRTEVRLQHYVDEDATSVGHELTGGVLGDSTVEYQVILALGDRFKTCKVESYQQITSTRFTNYIPLMTQPLVEVSG